MKRNANQVFASIIFGKKKSSGCGQEVICICMGTPQERRARARFATYMTLLAASLFLSQICIPASLKQNTFDASCIQFDSFEEGFFGNCISDRVYPAANVRLVHKQFQQHLTKPYLQHSSWIQFVCLFIAFVCLFLILFVLSSLVMKPEKQQRNEVGRRQTRGSCPACPGCCTRCPPGEMEILIFVIHLLHISIHKRVQDVADYIRLV